MNATQAAAHNASFPFTVAPCDNNRSFPVRSFTTQELAANYAAQQGSRPFVIAVPSGAVVAFG
jgi:hypothetical protein